MPRAECTLSNVPGTVFAHSCCRRGLALGGQQCHAKPPVSVARRGPRARIRNRTADARPPGVESLHVTALLRRAERESGVGPTPASSTSCQKNATICLGPERTAG